MISEKVNIKAADEQTEIEYRMLRMDAPVNHGNSGGGLFNSWGELIGIVSAKHIEEGVEGIGYSIPSNLAIAIAENIIDNCLETTNQKVRKALLGITVTISESRSVYDPETEKISIEETTVIEEVSETSALYGKLQPGDIINRITVGDKSFTVSRQYRLLDALLYARVGDEVVLRISRTQEDGTVNNISYSVTIGEENIITVE